MSPSVRALETAKLILAEKLGRPDCLLDSNEFSPSLSARRRGQMNAPVSVRHVNGSRHTGRF
jgi:hypothetical protein